MSQPTPQAMGSRLVVFGRTTKSYTFTLLRSRNVRDCQDELDDRPERKLAQIHNPSAPLTKEDFRIFLESEVGDE